MHPHRSLTHDEERFQHLVSQQRNNHRNLQERVVTVSLHIAYDNRTKEGYLDDESIRYQMRRLENAFSDFTFVLRDVNRYPDASFLKTCLLYEDEEFKLLNRQPQDGPDVMYVYVCHPSSSPIGWSYFPWDYELWSQYDSVMISYEEFPYHNYTEYQGGTLVHEVGHWLGLYHPFEGGCELGDDVADTPAMLEPRYDCLYFGEEPPDSCPDQPGKDLVTNFMDYLDDECSLAFTPGQEDRMRQAWDVYRSPNARIPGALNSQCTQAEILQVGSRVEASTFLAFRDNTTIINTTECPDYYDSDGPAVFYQVIGNGKELIASLCDGAVQHWWKMTLFEGSCDGMNCIKDEINDEGCVSIWWKSEVNESYIIHVESTEYLVGDFVITLKEFERATNDSCEKAVSLTGDTEIQSSTYGVNGTRIEACNRFRTGGQLWYTFDVPMSFSTCNPYTEFDSWLVVVAGTSCNDLQCIASANDYDDEVCSFLAVDELLANQTYYLVVHGLFFEEGEFKLDVQTLGTVDDPPTSSPSAAPIMVGNPVPSENESGDLPSHEPSAVPSFGPSVLPTSFPTVIPSTTPVHISDSPSSDVSTAPSYSITGQPTIAFSHEETAPQSGTANGSVISTSPALGQDNGEQSRSNSSGSPYLLISRVCCILLPVVMSCFPMW